MDPSDTLIKKIYGCIWGSLVGDALGTRYEFTSHGDATEAITKDKGIRTVLPMLGGGPFDLVPGQITDDGELTVSLLAAIVADKGLYNPNLVAQYYENWYRSKPFDIGRTTENAFNVNTSATATAATAAKPIGLYNKIKANSLMHNKESQSNGCLMRASPLGILGYFYNDQIRKLAEYDCSLTNPNQNCINAVEIYIMIISMLLSGNTSPEIYSKIRTIANNENRLFIEASRNTWQVTNKAGKKMPPDGKTMGFYGIALQNALYHLFKGSTYQRAMEETIVLGGDTDTNCCILGGILGAKYGIGGIPQEWLQKVQNLREPEYDRFTKLPIIRPHQINKSIGDFIKLRGIM